jgi:hypothetical protein
MAHRPTWPPKPFAARSRWPRPDVYGTGLVLHQCLTGTLPWLGDQSSIFSTRGVTARPRLRPWTVCPPTLATSYRHACRDNRRSGLPVPPWPDGSARRSDCAQPPPPDRTSSSAIPELATTNGLPGLDSSRGWRPEPVSSLTPRHCTVPRAQVPPTATAGRGLVAGPGTGACWRPAPAPPGVAARGDGCDSDGILPFVTWRS